MQDAVPITVVLSLSLGRAGLPFAPVMFGEINGQGAAAPLPDGVPYCSPPQYRTSANEDARPYVA